jgi:hypothetical protein
LKHKHRAIQLVQKLLQDLDALSQIEMEALIVAVNMLAVCEVQTDAIVRQSTISPFNPHWVGAHDQDIYRMQGVRAHMVACAWLVDRIGGLSVLREDFAYNLAL